MTEEERRKQREYRAKVKDKVRLWSKAARIRHGPELRRRSLEWHFKNRERSVENSRRWKSRNRNKVNDYVRKKMKTDGSFRLSVILRRKIWEATTEYTGRKRARVFELLVGCTVLEFRSHLQTLFRDGMDWTNQGKNGWEIDHIIPCCSFDLTDPEQLKKCFHYSNMHPLWWYENLAKGKQTPVSAAA